MPDEFVFVSDELAFAIGEAAFAAGGVGAEALAAVSVCVAAACLLAVSFFSLSSILKIFCCTTSLPRPASSAKIQIAIVTPVEVAIQGE